jgi:hypothetical protein
MKRSSKKSRTSFAAPAARLAASAQIARQSPISPNPGLGPIGVAAPYCSSLAHERRKALSASRGSSAPHPLS